MKKEKAKKLAIEKWDSIVHNGGMENKRYYTITKKMREKDQDCSYCYKYYIKKGSCKKCPLNFHGYYNNFACTQENHPFNIWLEERYNKLEAAKVVLQMIKDN